MLMPDEAITLIKMQRSNYGKKNIKKQYSKDIEKEFNQLIKFLPDTCNSIVDIGCGLAGMSILLSNYFSNPKLYLLDENKISEKVRYGFSEEDSFYNSFDILKKILEMNYIKNYSFIKPDNDFSEIKNVDLVISLLACGFHFPLFFYFGRIFNCLSEKGVFICDIRKTKYSEEIKTIELYFKKIEKIKTDNPKTIRICAKEPVCRE